MKRVDHIDRAILKVLFQLHGWVNTNQIADRVGIAWQTAENHLDKLNNFGYVVKGKKGTSFYWRANQ